MGKIGEKIMIIKNKNTEKLAKLKKDKNRKN